MESTATHRVDGQKAEKYGEKEIPNPTTKTATQNHPNTQDTEGERERERETRLATTMSDPPFLKKHTPLIVEKASQDLAESMRQLFGNKESLIDELQMRQLMIALYDEYADFPNAESMLENIVKMGVTKWRKLPPLQAKGDQDSDKPKSVSLWDQLGSFQPRVFWDDIRNETDPSLRLASLKRVEYLDDVCNDWNEVLGALQDGLNDDKRRTEYLQLHTDWFDRAGSTPEYQSLRVDLCKNTLTWLRRHFASNCHVALVPNIINNNNNSVDDDIDKKEPSIGFTNAQEVVFEVLQRWEDMFVQIMDNYWVDYGTANQMVFEVLRLFQTPPLPSRKEQEQQDPSMQRYGLSPTQFFAILDPFAKWFQYWIRQIPVQEALHVVRESNSLAHLWKHCHTSGSVQTSMSMTIPNDNRTDVDGGTVAGMVVHNVTLGDDVSIQRLDTAVHIQAVTMLCTIMVDSRVWYFPWDQLGDGNNNDTTTTTGPTWVHPSTLQDNSCKLPEYNFADMVKKGPKWKHNDDDDNNEKQEHVVVDDDDNDNEYASPAPTRQRLDFLKAINVFATKEQPMEGLAVVHAHAVEALLFGTPLDDDLYPELLFNAVAPLQQARHEHLEELYLMICRWADRYPEEATRYKHLMTVIPDLRPLFFETG